MSLIIEQEVNINIISVSINLYLYKSEKGLKIAELMITMMYVRHLELRLKIALKLSMVLQFIALLDNELIKFSVVFGLKFLMICY